MKKLLHSHPQVVLRYCECSVAQHMAVRWVNQGSLVL